MDKFKKFTFYHFINCYKREKIISFYKLVVL